MSILEWGAIGELVGGLAVILTLIYLALQIRHQTQSTRAATFDAMCTEIATMNLQIGADEGLARLWQTVTDDTQGGWDSLTPIERVRTGHLFNCFWRLLENMFSQHKAGMIDDQLWAGWHDLTLMYVRAKGIQPYWQLRKNTFSEDFVRFVETGVMTHEVATASQIQAR